MSGNHIHAELDQFGRALDSAAVKPVGVTPFDLNIVALAVSEALQPGSERIWKRMRRRLRHECADGATLPACSARAASGHATAAPPISLMNFRRRMCSLHKD